MIPEYLPEYDVVFVISDLHLGGHEVGGRNYRIFRDSDALGGFVESLFASESESRSGPTKRQCLVLNGDIIDYLAHEKPRYFDWENALEKLEDALADKEQRKVWSALKEFVKSGSGDLALVLGNHDLELALPDPQSRLLHYLTDGIAELRGRVHFAMDGAGFACRVGKKRILCLHGNEVDPWNAIEYGRLSLIRRALARGSMERNKAVLSNWIPNPGTQLVIDYMNGVKQRYQWVDLLKPEEEATAMITAAIAELPGVRTFAEVCAKRAGTAKRLADGFMAGTFSPEDGGAATPAAVQHHTTAADVNGSILEAVDALGRGARPEDMVSEHDGEYLMDTRELVRRTIALKAWPGGLRSTLIETIADDKFFDIDVQDDTSRLLDELCGPDADFLIAGHTHLHRAMARKRFPGRFYFNSGTWTRMLRIPKPLLSADMFPEVKRRLCDGRMTELEKPIEGPDGATTLLNTTRTVVRVQPDDRGTVRGELLTVENQASAQEFPSWKLVPVPGSTFPRPENAG